MILKQDLDLKSEFDFKSSSCRGHGLSPEEKVKEQYRIRQLAFKAREKMPKDYRSFCLVAAHLVKNAHRYFQHDYVDEESLKEEKSSQLKKEVSFCKNEPVENKEDECKEINKRLREIRTLKRQNRIREQQMLVNKLKDVKGSYRRLAKLSGIALKTVHEWCAEPKAREHKGTARSKLKQQDFINFLMQDTITYSHPCKKFAGKRFLMGTWEETYNKYVQQTGYHTHGVLSRTRMRCAKPKYVLLSGKIPLNQCLCDYCENCDLMLKGLLAAGIKGLPRNRYHAVDYTLCEMRQGQFGTDFQFCLRKCNTRECEECGTKKLRNLIEDVNGDLLKLNNRISWHRWQKLDGKSVPEKCQIKKPLRTAVTDFLDIIHDLSQHLFRANWNRNVFQFIKNNMVRGYVLQVMDFAMNFSNWYQDEVQSAYWNGTQTTIHATINFFLCPREGCNQIVTLAMVHISDDLHRDSFLTRAAQNMTFRYLVQIGIPLDLIIQFCDNCASQYKSRRPFAELARIALEIIRVYYGEKHGKSHADALFGRLKAWMSYKIKSRQFVVSDAHDFFKYCVEFYQTPKLTNCCQHYRVEFQFIRPSDVRRHQDCDLETHVDHTQNLYSVRNTSQPLQLKVRCVPCLCPSCIKDEGECYNSEHTDPWRIVNLIPQKGSNLRKYAKRKRPDEEVRNKAAPCIELELDANEELRNATECIQLERESDDADDELPDIKLDERAKPRMRKKKSDPRFTSKRKTSELQEKCAEMKTYMMMPAVHNKIILVPG